MLHVLMLATALMHNKVALSAASVADSVGINTHFGDTGSFYYRNSSTSLNYARRLGVKHFRDGISYLGTGSAFPPETYELFNELRRAGVGGDNIENCAATNDQSARFLQKLNNVEALEYPNEKDALGDGNWVRDLKECGVRLSQMISRFPGAILIGPSLVKMKSPAVIGPVPIQVNNLHAYFLNYPPDIDYAAGAQRGPDAGGGPCRRDDAGRWVCFPGLRFRFNNINADGPGKPVWITETGYVTGGVPSDAGRGQYMPAQYEAAYYIREILWAINNGVRRVYFYAVHDNIGKAYGLLDRLMKPKPRMMAFVVAAE